MKARSRASAIPAIFDDTSPPPAACSKWAVASPSTASPPPWTTGFAARAISSPASALRSRSYHRPPIGTITLHNLLFLNNLGGGCARATQGCPYVTILRPKVLAQFGNSARFPVHPITLAPRMACRQRPLRPRFSTKIPLSILTTMGLDRCRFSKMNGWLDHGKHAT